ncbi:C1 family peptidase [Bdellovibrio sp. HCB-162]|uniref:C1 family peptidase n=1 Tax=Bdellovibrio sp. HCB-162 TaxID=3394234 RepID=UPI0039BC4FB0
MRNYLKPGRAAIALTLSLYVSHALAQPSFDRPGLKEMTQEESQKLHKRKIKKVHPNRLGLERVNKERRQKGQAPLVTDTSLPEMEFDETQNGAKNTNTAPETTALGSAPAQVDNSVLPAFPVIANQGAQGSCVAWATTYYLMSHEVCLTLGCDNKTARARVYSPKWTYNMINGGVDNGSYFSDAFSVLEKHGAALMTDFPYDGNYLGWDMTSEHWKRAINSRMKASTYTSINTDTGMANVKQMLANGHVVVVGTYINSWVYRTVQANPNVGSNPFVGQAIATYMNGTVAGHAITIVGYDDTIWTDINGNGAVEPQEVGAFKFANSFGNTWKNQGYSWVSYDALRATSTVPGFAPAGRVQLTQSGVAYYTTYTPYTPKLLAEVNMSHALRSQASLQFGSSSNTASSPSATWTPSAFVNRGGGYAFDGTTVEKSGTFYFDISSLAGSDVSTQKFYLIMKDSAAGSALTTSAFNVINASVGNTLMSAPGVPMAVDATTKTLVAGTTPAPTPTPTPTPSPSDTIAPTAPNYFTANLETYQRNRKARVVLNWKGATDNVGVVKYYIYRNNVRIATATSLTYTDNNISKGINYTYQVSAVDAAGNESPRSFPITGMWQ